MIFGCLVILIVCFLLSAFEGWLFMVLWNWIAPIFWTAAPELTFWQGWGAWFLINLIGSAFKTIKNKN